MDSHEIASRLSLWEMGKKANSCNRRSEGRTHSWRVLFLWKEEPIGLIHKPLTRGGDRLAKIVVVGVHVATVSHRLKQAEEANVCLQDLVLIVREVL